MGGAGLLNSLGGLGSGIMSTGSQLGQSGAMQQLQGGGVMQADANAQDQAALQAYQMFQQQPWTPLQDASKIVQARQWGNVGDTSSTTSESDNAVGGALGGAATGATLGSAIGPWGTAIGAVGGAIAGAFG